MHVAEAAVDEPMTAMRTQLDDEGRGVTQSGSSWQRALQGGATVLELETLGNRTRVR